MNDAHVHGNRLRRRLHRMLDPAAWPRQGLSPLNRAVALLIIASVVAAIVESEQTILRDHENLFFWIESGFALLFTIEYLLRIWVAVDNPHYAGAVTGRLRYALTPAALLDLIAILPLMLSLMGSEAFLLRLFRLVRILRLAKLGRYSEAISAIQDALRSRRYELAMSLVIAALLLLVTSTLLYIAESEVQPQTFGSIPRAMWWSIATLTTVGYGDVVPVTFVGRLLAGATAIIGIGLIAMPTGILASAFSDALAQRRAALAARRHHETSNPPA